MSIVRATLYNVCIFLIMILFMPVCLAISVAALIMNGAPILYRQKRIGKNGKPFVIYKFRTMIPGAEKKQAVYRRYNEADGPVFKLRRDPRYTTVGKFLAHTGLDELPQLYNVLRGDMALFGPRPLPVSEERKLKAWHKVREHIKPGIISSAILTGTYHEDFTAWMKSDVAYAKKKSFFYDLNLAERTLVFLAKLFIREMAHTFGV